MVNSSSRASVWGEPPRWRMSEAELAEAMVERVMNIQTAFVGEGRHFIQQDQPEMIGRTLADWRRGSGGR